MKNKEIDLEILNLYNVLKVEFSAREKKYVHFKSLSNFVYYLVENPTLNKKRNIRLQQIKEIGIKNELLEYLNIVLQQKKISKQESIKLFNKYFDSIGRFMAEYYDFSGLGGQDKILILVIVLFFGLFLDGICYLFFEITLPIFIPCFVLIFFSRIYLKQSSGKLYGTFY